MGGGFEYNMSTKSPVPALRGSVQDFLYMLSFCYL